MEKKKTLVLGATTNPGRYAYLAAHRLVAAGHDIVNIGIKNGESAGVEIQRAGAAFPDINTVTLYIGPQRQPEYYDRSEEHTSELQSLMRISYAVFCLKKKTNITNTT